jgi:ethanolamine utilization protein EutN
MNIAKIIGTVWATRKHPSLEGYRLQIMQPLNSRLEPVGSFVVGTDAIGSGQPGEIVYYVTSGEAPIPFGKKIPTDVTIIGIVDRIDHLKNKV